MNEWVVSEWMNGFHGSSTGSLLIAHINAPEEPKDFYSRGKEILSQPFFIHLFQSFILKSCLRNQYAKHQ